MDCQSARAILSQALDDALDAAAAAELKAHLDHCPACDRELEGLRGLGRLLRSLPASPLPAGFMSRLEQRRAPADASAPRAWAFAACAVLVGLVVYQRGRQNRLQAPGSSAETLRGPALAPPAPLRPQTAAGNPPGAKTPYSNEALQHMLQDESERIGIQEVSPKDDDRPDPLLGERLGQPETRELAEIGIRRIAAMRRAVDAARKEPKPVAIEGGTVTLLAEKDSAKGASLESGVSAEASWRGDYSGGNDGTRTISDAKAWRRLWRSLSKAPAPGIDFKKSQVVAVFLGHRATGGFSVDIVSVESGASSLIVRYRETAPPPGTTPPPGATSPYALRAVPRSDLPVRFERVPIGLK